MKTHVLVSLHCLFIRNTNLNINLKLNLPKIVLEISSNNFASIFIHIVLNNLIVKIFMKNVPGKDGEGLASKLGFCATVPFILL